MRATIALISCLFLLLCPLLGAEPLYHVLQKGETVYSVARSFKVSPQAILEVNGIGDPTKVRVGQRLLIPQAPAPQPPQAPKTHAVKKGETLYGIARLHGVELADLLSLNKLGASSALRPGQVLLLPPGPAPKTGPGTEVAKTGSQPKDGGPMGPKPGDKTVSSRPPSPGPDKDPASVGAFPPLVRTSSKRVDARLALPCSGEARYLDGKIDGIMILCEKGAASKAVSSGRVVSAGPYRGFGLVVFVEGRGGYIYVYGGNESLGVKVGDSVSPGLELGKVGFDAREGRPAAYFLVFKNGKSLDPASISPGQAG